MLKQNKSLQDLVNSGNYSEATKQLLLNIIELNEILYQARVKDIKLVKVLDKPTDKNKVN